MPARVVDASVVAARFFIEPRSAEAETLLRGHRLFAPDILRYELAGVALHKLNLSSAANQTIRDNLHDALRLPIRLIRVSVQGILNVALEAELTTYDASYLFLARRLKCPLATFDRKLARAAERESLLAR
ncbi:MAG: type II toxin-antitoxin system VapC family toxin [Candidatus Binataceae bacterium]